MSSFKNSKSLKIPAILIIYFIQSALCVSKFGDHFRSTGNFHKPDDVITGNDKGLPKIVHVNRNYETDEYDNSDYLPRYNLFDLFQSKPRQSLTSKQTNYQESGEDDDNNYDPNKRYSKLITPDVDSKYPDWLLDDKVGPIGRSDGFHIEKLKKLISDKLKKSKTDRLLVKVGKRDLMCNMDMYCLVR
ncbi:hypothetical protein HELRODRAFT_176216 [Helobdella robusta]|uniref:Uncharacterized protein n=1 Tax=Helobdella robusta TaxID=6412 RepID=T1FAB1_HELRO|nr:hypothetical protein HELRODRAFT_176216 [Helobdella robusta]ESN99920.1 hypothetical protein HELRODRAFT_176216 [Helobdella robusta]